jgi:hypothetical protein
MSIPTVLTFESGQTNNIVIDIAAYFVGIGNENRKRRRHKLVHKQQPLRNRRTANLFDRSESNALRTRGDAIRRKQRERYVRTVQDSRERAARCVRARSESRAATSPSVAAGTSSSRPPACRRMCPGTPTPRNEPIRHPPQIQTLLDDTATITTHLAIRARTKRIDRIVFDIVGRHNVP